jgi:type I restriction enzyme S subunit
MTRLKFHPGVSPTFAAIQLHYLWMMKYYLHRCVKHVNQASISTKDMARTIPFVLPPINEQKRIVAKIEELFSELDNGIAALKTAREQLKVYRQAVLKHAFEGQLTAKWREENANKLESPEQLLARIQQEREARYQQQLEEWEAAVKAWEANGKEGKKPGKPKNLAILTPVPEASKKEFPLLPSGWSYIRLGNLIDEPTYGTSAKCDYELGDQSVLRIPNISIGRIDDSDLKFASFEKGEVDHLRLMEGDILTIRSNGSISLVGSCALINEKDTKHIFAGYLIRLRPNCKAVKSEYLLSAMSSHFLRKQIESAAKSTSGVNNINSGELQNLIIPLPSVSEQEELISELDSTLSMINSTEFEIDQQLAKTEILRQSILKKPSPASWSHKTPTMSPPANCWRVFKQKRRRRERLPIPNSKPPQRKKAKRSKHDCGS